MLIWMWSLTIILNLNWYNKIGHYSITVQMHLNASLLFTDSKVIPCELVWDAGTMFWQMQSWYHRSHIAMVCSHCGPCACDLPTLGTPCIVSCIVCKYWIFCYFQQFFVWCIHSMFSFSVVYQVELFFLVSPSSSWLVLVLVLSHHLRSDEWKIN